MTETFRGGVKFKKFLPNYFSFFVNGAMVLIVGAVLPYVIDEAKISFAVAGSLLSFFAIGNFLASFVNPFLTRLWGRKFSIFVTSLFMPLSLAGISFLPHVSGLLLLFVLLGISRGCYSVINNAYINENTDGTPAALNILHMVFAVGAFCAPMIMSVFFYFDFSWRAILYTLVVASLGSAFFMLTLDFSEKRGTGDLSTENSPDKNEKNSRNERLPFWKHPLFYLSGLLLFFYLGLENCVNGWFVTYFKNTGIMSPTFANSLVSFTWLAVLFGRLLTAYISRKVKKQVIILFDCLITALFFVVLISTKNLGVITFAIVGLGFFFAGIYPTTVSNASAAIVGSDLGTSMLLAIAALGGIITPQIVGIAADKIGLTGAVCLLLINAVVMIALAVVNFFLKRNIPLQS